MTNTYWNHNGKYQERLDTLSNGLVPISGPADTEAGEILRAVSQIYYDLYNNGFGNQWKGFAMYLLDRVPKLSSETQFMFFDHGGGVTRRDSSFSYDRLCEIAEEMVDTVIEHIEDNCLPADSFVNTTDSLTFSHYRFEDRFYDPPEDEDYFNDDDDEF